MASMNKCLFIGNVSSDIDNRVCKTGLQISNFSIAINEKSKQGDITTFVNVKVFGKLAEICKQYLSKGQSVLVEGKYRTETWEDKKTGTKRYSNYIMAENVQFMSSKQNSSERAIETQNTAYRETKPKSKYPPTDNYTYPDSDSVANDIEDVVPF